MTGRLALGAALALSLPCLVVPLRNPDLYWHLSAARAMTASGAVPTADFLSTARPGAPWLDFEWLPQLLYYAVYRAAGCAGLVALRALVIGVAAAAAAAVGALAGLDLAEAALASALLICAIFPYADLRPDNFSLLFFGVTLYALERARRARARPGWGLYAVFAAGFALWANVHLGLVFGLGLCGLYAAAAAVDAWRRGESLALSRTFAGLAAAGATGSLANPYAWRLYAVVGQHAAFMRTLSGAICEWKPPRLDAYWLWPYTALLAAGLAAQAALVARRPRVSLCLPFALAYFGAASVFSQRHLTYFCLVAAPATVAAARELLGARARRALGLAAFAALAGYSWRVAWPMAAADLCGDAPRPLADFLDEQRGALAGKKLYNTWEDGGYLGWRLYPAYRVFYDGRYIFHSDLEDVLAAAKSAERWKAYSTRQGFEVACMRRSALHAYDETLAVAGGRSLVVRRPYYQAYLPRRDWAVVFWDDRRFIAVKRRAVDAAWLRAHEYRLLLPDDPAGPAASERAPRPPLRELRAELERHRHESGASAAAREESHRLQAWLDALAARSKAS